MIRDSYSIFCKNIEVFRHLTFTINMFTSHAKQHTYSSSSKNKTSMKQVVLYLTEIAYVKL